MTSTQAKQIAINYMRQQSDYVFSEVTVKNLASTNGPIKVWLTTEDDYGDELIVEVEMNPQSNEIRWKKICNTGRLSEYLKPATRIDKLSAGQRFRLQGDCVVYEFVDNVKDRSSIPYIRTGPVAYRESDGRRSFLSNNRITAHLAERQVRIKRYDDETPPNENRNLHDCRYYRNSISRPCGCAYDRR